MATVAHKIPRRYRASGEQFVEGSSVRYLRDGAQAYPAMLEAIRGARQQVLFEMYWFGADRSGQIFAAAMAERARAGVEVALMYDSVGSLETSDSFFDELRAAGGRVHEFNPVAPWRRRFRLDRLQVRDHRKILVVDGIVGFTGGINIGDPWAPETEGGGAWRDDAICLEGPVVETMRILFERTWIGQGQPALRRPSTALELTGAPARIRVLGESVSPMRLRRGPRLRRHIRRAYLSRSDHSTRRVWLSNSYFVPDPVVLRALRRAAKRGVDVRIIVPGISDVPATKWAGRATYSRLLRSGVRIFEWGGNVLHSKTAVIDGHWTTIGSYNLDYRSLRYNLEVNVAVDDEGFARQVEESLAADQSASLEIDRATWAARPLGHRLLERLCYYFRTIL
jgi:cardiolipin synthase